MKNIEDNKKTDKENFIKLIKKPTPPLIIPQKMDTHEISGLEEKRKK